jgi:hypothetical protein
MSDNKEVLEKLETIKNLLVLLSIKVGANSEEVGRAAGMGASTIRKMFPMRKTKKVD